MTVIRIKSLSVYAFGFCESFAKILIPMKWLSLLRPSYINPLCFFNRYSSIWCLREIGSKVCLHSRGWVEQAPRFLSRSSKVCWNQAWSAFLIFYFVIASSFCNIFDGCGAGPISACQLGLWLVATGSKSIPWKSKLNCCIWYKVSTENALEYVC